MYGVETKQLKRQVKRNGNRFPKDFMFELTKKEFEKLRSQIGTSSWGGTRYMPMAFTEQSAAMLSSVLNSETAIAVNIRIIWAFTKRRAFALTRKDIENIFMVLKELIEKQSKLAPRNKIDFRRSEEE